jgi:hypothetical protein
MLKAATVIMLSTVLADITSSSCSLGEWTLMQAVLVQTSTEHL